ncbi:unnamed protein product [Larinioides sclopetarius]|uniref:Uncharacterized protein n=1 Tax=Larinioides sclopetarius TaxID=280406 RepID=A0AAV1Z1V1_9ARAC
MNNRLERETSQTMYDTKTPHRYLHMKTHLIQRKVTILITHNVMDSNTGTENYTRQTPLAQELNRRHALLPAHIFALLMQPDHVGWLIFAPLNSAPVLGENLASPTLTPFSLLSSSNMK